jgi:hypothetical protein
MQARRKQFKSGGGSKFFERETTDNSAREIAQELLGKQYKKRERRKLEICRITNSYFVGRGEAMCQFFIPVSYFTSRKLYNMYVRNIIIYSFL